MTIGAEVLERFWRHVDKDHESGCWLWTAGLTTAGYGQFNASEGGVRRTVRAHTFAWEILRGPRGDLQLDHVCHSRSTCDAGNDCIHRRCLNPDHLELVTPAENARRAAANNRAAQRQKWAERTHCKQGHPWTPENLTLYVEAARGITRARCKTCNRAYAEQVRRMSPPKPEFAVCQSCGRTLRVQGISQHVAACGTCSVDGCDKPNRSNGICQTHYYRARKLAKASA